VVPIPSTGEMKKNDDTLIFVPLNETWVWDLYFDRSIIKWNGCDRKGSMSVGCASVVKNTADRSHH